MEHTTGAASAAIFLFPGTVRKGRENAARTAPRPEGVVSLADYRADQCDPDILLLQGVLIGTVIQHLDADTLAKVHGTLRDMGKSEDPERRAVGKALSALTGGMILKRVEADAVFIRESDGKAFNVKGEAL